MRKNGNYTMWPNVWHRFETVLYDETFFRRMRSLFSTPETFGKSSLHRFLTSRWVSPWNYDASLSVNSVAHAFSTAVCNANVFSASNLCWIYCKRKPQKNGSRIASTRSSANSQVSANFRSLARYCLTVSSSSSSASVCETCIFLR